MSCFNVTRWFVGFSWGGGWINTSFATMSIEIILSTKKMAYLKTKYIFNAVFVKKRIEKQRVIKELEKPLLSSDCRLLCGCKDK